MRHIETYFCFQDKNSNQNKLLFTEKHYIKCTCRVQYMIVIKGADFLSWGNQKCFVRIPLSLILNFIMVDGRGSSNKSKKTNKILTSFSRKYYIYLIQIKSIKYFKLQQTVNLFFDWMPFHDIIAKLERFSYK